MVEMTPEQKLAAIFADQAPPGSDAAFCFQVMERTARRRAWSRVAASAPWAVSGAIVAWAAQPALSGPLEALARDLATANSILGMGAVLTLCALMAVRRIPDRSRRTART